MTCSQMHDKFSLYLDGALSGAEMRGLAEHFSACIECRAQFDSLRATRSLVAGLGPRRAPEGHVEKVRIALAQEIARARQPWWERSGLMGFTVRLQNSLNAFMFPATAGVLTAVVFFGLLIGFFVLPGTVQAANDVPLRWTTPPRLESSPFSTTLGAAADSVVVETVVDAQGRVQDYRVISAPENSQKTLQQLDNMMIFTTFRPATSFGHPIPGRVVVSFSLVNVKG